MAIDITTLGLDFDISGLLRGRRELDNTTDSANRTANAADHASNKFSALSSMSGMLKAALAGIGVGLLAKEFIETADAVSLMDARLKLAMGSTADFEQAQKDVYAIAQKNSVSLSSTAALYTKLAEPIKNAGGSVKEIKGIVDAFSTSLKVSGASSEEASSAVLQFGQAMAAGALSGDELKSLAETSPRFMKALADGMGVPVGQIKKLGAEGKLTADIIGNALIGSLDKLNAEAKSLPDTTGGALTRFKNDLVEAVRYLNNDVSVTGGLVGIIETARSLIPDVRDELAGAFKAAAEWVERNRDGLGEAWENAKLLVGEIWETAKAAASVVGFLAEWGTQSGNFNSAITVARYGVALLQDGVTYLAAGFAQFGSLILQSVTKPMLAAAKIAADIVGVFDPARADAMRASMAGVKEMAEAGMKWGAGVAESFAKGDSAVMRLDRSINGVKLTTNSTAAVLSSVSDAFDKLKGGKGGKDDDKAAKAANKELAKQADLMAELSGLTASFAEDWDRLSKLYSAGKLSLEGLTQAQATLLGKQPAMKQAADNEAKARKESAEFEKEYQASLSATDNILRDRLEKAEEEAKQNELLASTYGLTKSAIEYEAVARLQAQLDQRATLGLTLDEIDHLEKLIAVKKSNADALVKTEGGPDLNAAQTALDAMSALDQSTQSAAQNMASAFGGVGEAIGGMTTALSAYGRTQAAIEAERLASIKGATGTREEIAKKINAAEIKASQQSAQASMKSYGDMAGAAKGFFKEQSTGYKLMETAEKSFRMMEMAMAIDNMIIKSGLITGYTGIFVASKATEATAETAKTGLSVGLAGTEASAWGIVAVVKSLASLPFPWNLAAGAATLAAVVAIGASMMGGVGGGSAVDPNSAAERQKVQGTGTVLGDPTAKSESMANSLEIMEKYASLELGYQSSMLDALRNIESSLGGAAKGIMNTTGITGGSAFGNYDWADENTFSSSKTKNIVDSGVKFGGTFGELRSGGGKAVQYEDVRTTSDGGMFRSGWTRMDTYTKGLSEEARRSFTQIFDDMGELIVSASVQLGYDAQQMNDWLNAFTINLPISLRGLTGQDLIDELNAGVGSVFDSMVKHTFPFVEKFQKMGEGLGETLVRIAADVAAVDSVFASLGKSTWGMGIEAKEVLVMASGGMEEFATQAKSFMQNFYTEAEQIAATKAKLNPVLRQYGLTTEGADAQRMFKEFVLGLDTSTEAGAKTYAMLMDLQQAFYDVTDAARSQRESLQDELDELVMSSAQLLAKQRAAIDPANRALFDNVQLAKRMREEQDKAGDSYKTFIDNTKAFADALRKQGDSLLTGSLSVLTPEQQYVELRSQYEDIRDRAMAGDADAQEGYTGALNAFLSASQKINGGDAQYAADFAMAQSDIGNLEEAATAQVSTAEAQLLLLQEQNDGIAALVGLVSQIVDQYAAPTAVEAPGYYYRENGYDLGLAIEEDNRRRSAGETTIVTSATGTTAVTAELTGLRADLRAQTAATIQENARAQGSTARLIAGAIERVAARSNIYNQAKSIIE